MALHSATLSAFIDRTAMLLLAGAIFSLHMLGELALVNRNCCATACNLGQEVLLLLDYTGDSRLSNC